MKHKNHPHHNPFLHAGERYFAIIIATFFGSGLSPIAPGTAGSLASLIFWIPLLYCNASTNTRLIVIAAIFLIGIWASNAGIKYFKTDDPKQVVIDEVAGQGIALLLIGPNIFHIAISFLLFRFFDALKPWPISYFDRTLRGGFGIMFDDVVAGIFAMLIMMLVGF